MVWTLCAPAHLATTSGLRGLPQGIQLDNGRLLICANHKLPSSESLAPTKSYTIYSDDHGATWHNGANVGPQHMGECSLAQGATGVFLYARVCTRAGAEPFRRPIRPDSRHPLTPVNLLASKFGSDPCAMHVCDRVGRLLQQLRPDVDQLHPRARLLDGWRHHIWPRQPRCFPQESHVCCLRPTSESVLRPPVQHHCLATPLGTCDGSRTLLLFGTIALLSVAGRRHASSPCHLPVISRSSPGHLPVISRSWQAGRPRSDDHRRREAGHVPRRRPVGL